MSLELIAAASETWVLEEAVGLAREALVQAMMLVLPILLAGLGIGLVVSLIQALTQIQEQTLSFIPKILGVGATLFILLPWMLTQIVEYTIRRFEDMGGGLNP